MADVFDISTIRGAMTRIIDNFLSAHINNQRPPARVYHYTDSNGLFGILKSGNLWFHDVFAMNDPSELSHGFNIFRTVVASQDCPEIFREFYHRNLEPMLNGLTENHELHDVGYFCVCSFSKTKGDVGQWRAYADDGRGVALSFNTRTFENHFALGNPGCQTFPVQYNQQWLRRLYTEVLHEIWLFAVSCG
jgi:hypothetical protein